LAIVLHELHQRRLEATVKLLNDSLERIALQLSKKPVGREDTGIVNTLSAETQAELRRALSAFHQSLREFAKRFGLQRHPIDIRQFLNAELSTAWVMLENCRPRRMKGYGVVFEEESKKELEASVEHLLHGVSKIRELLP
jgi:hypothetical protein